MFYSSSFDIDTAGFASQLHTFLVSNNHVIMATNHVLISEALSVSARPASVTAAGEAELCIFIKTT